MCEVLGGCRCGNVRILATGSPRRVGVCHCHDCRKHHGALFHASAVFAQDAVTIQGDTCDHAGRHFARNVGHLFSLRAMTKLKCTWGLLMSKISLSRHMKSGPYIVKRGCNRSRAPHNTNVAVIALIKGREVFIAPLFSIFHRFQFVDHAFDHRQAFVPELGVGGV